MVDLKSKPFYLSDEQIEWVFTTLESMSPDEKIGQLFVDYSEGETEESYIRERVSRTKCGGLRYRNLPPQEMKKHNLDYQRFSKYPLLIASNIEGGGNGACQGGTFLGQEIKIAATGDERYAYELGYCGAREALAVGCNMSFTPVVDITYNWRNPAISTRAWSDNVETVIRYSKECLRGLHDAGIMATAKHFPGDGADERDQHFSFSVNDLSCEEWDRSYGRVYQEMIDGGVEAIMAGHIMLPAYQRFFNGSVSDDGLLPASLCKELLNDLLRKKLGFNGLIVTDASHMVGMSSRMPRRDGLVQAINAGCDMILFFNDIEEDLKYMKEALEDGRLSAERLNEAVTRSLGLKAKARLYEINEENVPYSLDVVGCERHRRVAAEIADKGITLAKYKDDFLPVSIEKNRRVLVVPIVAPMGGFARMITGQSGDSEGPSVKTARKIVAKLNALGYRAELFESPLKKNNVRSQYDYKSSIEEFKDRFDLVIDVAQVPVMDVVQRLSWETPKGGFEVPWYVYDKPVIFASFCCPFHLADVPQIKCYINCYDSADETIDSFIDKITGKTPFSGKSPVDVFCGKIDTRI